MPKRYGVQQKEISPKKLEIINRLKQLDSTFTRVDDTKLSKYSISDLGLIEKLVNDGYDAKLFVGTKPTELLRMNYSKTDLTQYPWVKLASKSSREKIQCLEITLNAKLDDFMYQVYADAVPSYLVELLHKNLVNGRNFTRELDYRKLDLEQACTYVELRSKGVDKYYAYNYGKDLHTNWGNRASKEAYGLCTIYREWDKNDKDGFDELFHFVKENTNGLQFYNLCQTYKLDYKHYSHYCNERFKGFLLITSRTKEQFEMDPSEDAFRQYLTGWMNIDCSKYPVRRTDNKISKGYPVIVNALIEACHYGNQDVNTYLPHLTKLSTNALKCIACGLDIAPYLCMGVDGSLGMIYESDLNSTPERVKIVGKLLFTHFYKESGF